MIGKRNTNKLMSKQIKKKKWVFAVVRYQIK